MPRLGTVSVHPTVIFLQRNLGHGRRQQLGGGGGRCEPDRCVIELKGARRVSGDLAAAALPTVSKAQRTRFG